MGLPDIPVRFLGINRNNLTVSKYFLSCFSMLIRCKHIFAIYYVCFQVTLEKKTISITVTIIALYFHANNVLFCSRV